MAERKPQTAKQLLASRQGAYREVLDPAKPKTFAVLKDLAEFCRARKSTFHPDARVHAPMEGRREVWLRIEDQLNLTEDQLASLYGAIDHA